jgi:hypothetical protein
MTRFWEISDVNKYEANLFLITVFLQRSLYFIKYDVSLYSMGNLENDFGGI